MTLRLISDFKAEGELKRQLNTLERNVRSETDALTFAKMDRLKQLDLGATQTIRVAPGEAANVDTSTADVRVLITKPRPEDAGKFIALNKRVSANSLNLEVIESTIDASPTYVQFSRGLLLIYCDGVEYWL